MDPTTQQLLEFVRKQFRRPELETQSPLMNGVVDSLGVFSIVSFLENAFNVVLDDAELTPEHFHSVEAIAQLLKSKQTA